MQKSHDWADGPKGFATFCLRCGQWSNRPKRERKGCPTGPPFISMKEAFTLYRKKLDYLEKKYAKKS